MNKRHWITILMDGSIADGEVNDWIDTSYRLVSASLTKSLKSELSRL